MSSVKSPPPRIWILRGSGVSNVIAMFMVLSIVLAAVLPVIAMFRSRNTAAEMASG